MKKAVLLSTEENLLQTMNEDLLDRNKDLKNFCNLLQHQQGMSSIAIDGRWGSGKTFFVKQCALLLNLSIPLSEVHVIRYKSPHNPLKKSIFFKF